MKIKFISSILMAAGLFCLSACSKSSDGPSDPDGTITLNMMNEEKGKTYLGDSDVYIDNANNFYGQTCSFAYLGEKSGLGKVSEPELSALADKVAVMPGSAYQVFRRRALLEFPSGTPALATAGDYYNVYVDSDIMQDGTVVGARIRYVLADVHDYGLPAYGKSVGTLDANNDITIELPTTDFEYLLEETYNEIECIQQGKKLIIRLTEYVYDGEFILYIRIRGSYTEVWGEVTN